MPKRQGCVRCFHVEAMDNRYWREAVARVARISRGMDHVRDLEGCRRVSGISEPRDVAAKVVGETDRRKEQQILAASAGGT